MLKLFLSDGASCHPKSSELRRVFFRQFTFVVYLARPLDCSWSRVSHVYPNHCCVGCRAAEAAALRRKTVHIYRGMCQTFAKEKKNKTGKPSYLKAKKHKTVTRLNQLSYGVKKKQQQTSLPASSCQWSQSVIPAPSRCI